jgi:hypothetical protein
MARNGKISFEEEHQRGLDFLNNEAALAKMVQEIEDSPDADPKLKADLKGKTFNEYLMEKAEPVRKWWDKAAANYKGNY